MRVYYFAMVFLFFLSCKTTKLFQYCEGSDNLPRANIKVEQCQRYNTARIVDCQSDTKTVDRCKDRSYYTAECLNATHDGVPLKILFKYDASVHKPEVDSDIAKACSKFDGVLKLIN